MKKTVKFAKRMADWKWGERLQNDFQGNKKMFRREVKLVRKGEQVRDVIVKDVKMVKYFGMVLRRGGSGQGTLSGY